MELVDGNTGQRVDLTDKIRSCLKKFAKFLILKIQDVMPAPSDKVYKYVYFGGVAPILETSIHEVIEEMYGVEIAQANHIFLPDSRKLNLYGLEVKVVVKCCKNREISIARKEEPHYGSY